MVLSKRIIITVAVMATLAAVTVVPASATHPDERCYGVQTVGQASTTFAGINDVGQPFFAGDVDVRLGGLRLDDVAVTTLLLDPETTSHVIEFPLGTITTRDAVILVPTDDPLVMSLRSRLKVVDGGTGRFHVLPKSTLTLVEVAEGELPVPVAAAWRLRGHVCFDG